MNTKPLVAVCKKPPTEYLLDSLKLYNRTYKVVQAHPHSDTDFPLCIIYENDTVYKHHSRASNGFSFEDFDRNGIQDIILHQLSNVGGVKEWIVLDTKTNKFREIKKFNEFPSAERLSGTKYFYSDHNMGCAGADWGSELFYIDNFKARAVANIIIVNCVDTEHARGVSIYKIQGQNQYLIEHLAQVPPKFSNDADFFRNYWEKNFKRYE